MKLKQSTIVILALLGIVGIGLVSCGGCLVSTLNTEVDLRTRIRAKSKKGTDGRE